MSARDPDAPSVATSTVEPTFFPAPGDFRAWLEANHATARELWVGFYKKGSGRPSITWPEAVDQALCYGWIDSVRKGINDEAYMNRFTPRKRGSTWSAVNVKRATELIREGSMQPPGLAAFEARSEDKTAIYSYEQRDVGQLDPELERQFRSNDRAWRFFESRAPSYRRAAVWWVVGAKKEETRQARLATLIDYSERGLTVPPLTTPSKRTSPDGGAG